MAHHTIRESERLTKLSERKCDLDDVESIIARVVSVAVIALLADAAAPVDLAGTTVSRAR